MTNLTNIYSSFKNASDKSSVYLNVNSEFSFFTENKKKTNLLEIFRQAHAFLEKNFKPESDSKIEKQINDLTGLKSFGNILYQRYNKKNKSLFRLIARLIDFIIPQFIKKKFPKIFPPIKHIQTGTLDWHTKFCKIIDTIKEQLLNGKDNSKSDEDLNKGKNPDHNKEEEALFPKNETPLPEAFPVQPNSFKIQTNNTTSTEFFRKVNGENEEELTTSIPETTSFDDLSYIQQQAVLARFFEQQKRDEIAEAIFSSNQANSMNQSKGEKVRKKIPSPTIENPVKNLNFLFAIFNQDLDTPLFFEKAKEALKRIHFHLKLFFIFPKPANFSDLIQRWNVTEDDLNLFAKADFYNALINDDSNELIQFLKETSFSKKIEQSILSYKEARFVVRKLNQNVFFRFKDSSGVDKPESFFNDFDGKIILNSSDVLEFYNFQKIKPSFSVQAIEIRCDNADGKLNRDILLHLMALSDKTPFFILRDFKEIHLEEMNFNEGEFKNFIRLLLKTSCPEIETLTLPKSEQKISPKQLSMILDFCPELSVLKQCFTYTESRFKIILPSSLLCKSTLILNDFSSGEANFVLRQIPLLKKLRLESSTIKNREIEDFIRNGYFQSLEELNLSQLAEINTDILFSLTTLPKLRKIHFPSNLKLGSRPLSELPSFNDPFKIVTFYAESPITSAIAVDKYTGPTAWMPVFQIPLAKKGVEKLFRRNDQTLDSFSCSLWLYKDNYSLLQPQSEITSLLIDDSSYINDDNIIEFIRKFPNTELLSLQNASKLTNVGLERIIKFLPKTKIQTLDLTNCYQINIDPFCTESNLSKLRKLKKLILIGTAISSESIDLFDFKKKITFEQTKLTITNEEIENLDDILNNSDLSKLTTLDFTNCNELTNIELRKVLLRLRSSSENLLKKLSCEKLDKQALAISNLILTGCTQITDHAFYKNLDGNNAINLLPLRSVSQIVKNDTQISDHLISHYPDISFRDSYEPFTREINVDKALESINLLKRKAALIKAQPDKAKIVSLRNERQQFINNRILLNLFLEDCSNKPQCREVSLESFDLYSNEFTTATVQFKTFATDPRSFDFDIHYSIAESSTYFKELFGGKLQLNETVGLENQNVSEEAVRVLREVLYTNSFQPDLHWRIAAQTAELVKGCLGIIGNVYNRLLQRFRDQFTLSDAEEMIFVANQLEDDESRTFFENKLIEMLKNNPRLCSELVKYANTFGMKELKKECTTASASFARSLQSGFAY